jgi:hypothetical protein
MEIPDKTIAKKTATLSPTMIDVTGGKLLDAVRTCGDGLGAGAWLVVEDQLFGTSTAVRRHSGHTSLRAPNENAGSCRPQAMQLAIHPFQSVRVCEPKPVIPMQLQGSTSKLTLFASWLRWQ